jgi:uncharacterized protein (UPF0297 family)
VKYLAIRNLETEKLAGVIVHDTTGKIYYTTAKRGYLDILKMLLSKDKYYVERLKNARTVIRVEVNKKDEDFLDIIKTKLSVPYTTYSMGKIGGVIRSKEEAVDRVWNLFSKDEHQEVLEA